MLQPLDHRHLRALRKRLCPGHGGQAAFARALGYEDPADYRKIESGRRSLPFLMPRLMQLLEERGEIPDGWRR